MQALALGVLRCGVFVHADVSGERRRGPRDAVWTAEEETCAAQVEEAAVGCEPEGVKVEVEAAPALAEVDNWEFRSGASPRCKGRPEADALQQHTGIVQGRVAVHAAAKAGPGVDDCRRRVAVCMRIR